MQEHISSQTPDPSTEAMREHFVKRLIPHVRIKDRSQSDFCFALLAYTCRSSVLFCSQDRQAPTRALQLQLAMQEYQLLTRELDSLSPREWAGGYSP